MKHNQDVMKTKIHYALLLCALMGACSSPSDKDVSRPQILPQGDYASPLNCQQFERGSTLPFAYVFRDDVELGSFNMEIHNNFDHHSHSTEADECRQDPVKTPVDPWVFNRDYPIPSGKTRYEATMSIPVPEHIDTGEYHFMIRVTDTSGWQELKTISIRII